MTNVPNPEWIDLIELERLERQIQPQTLSSTKASSSSSKIFKQTVLAIASIYNTKLYTVRNLDLDEYFQLLFAINNEDLDSALESALLITDLLTDHHETYPNSCKVCITIRSVTKCDRNAQNDLWMFLCTHYPMNQISSTTVLQAWSILDATRGRHRSVGGDLLSVSSGLDTQSPFLHVHEIPALLHYQRGLISNDSTDPKNSRDFNSDGSKLGGWPDSALLACLNHLGMQIFDPENTYGFSSSALYALGVLVKMHAHALFDVPSP